MNDAERMPWPRWLALFLLAAGCAGPMGGGIAGTSSVQGAISGLGSIVVGGIEFETEGATVTIEGEPVSASELGLGMVATVRGVVARGGRHGIAERVAVDNFAEGPIESLDAGTGAIGLLGQEVIVDELTVFAPVPLAALAVGDTIDVGGFLDAEGRIRATRINRKTDDLEIELRGYVSGHDGMAKSFNINRLTIEYGDAFLENVPPSGLDDGLFVEIDAAEPPSDDVMVATDLTVLDPALPFDEGDGLGIEGFVTSVESPTEVVVGGSQRIRITPATRFEGGGGADIILDAQLDVDGYADADGTLIALEIEFLS